MSVNNITSLQSVQSTMLIPLWGRAKMSRLYPEIFIDDKAIEIIERLDYDFSGIEKAFGEFGGISYIARAIHTDTIIKNFIKRYPKATIVNIGAGLDTTFSRVDNGIIKWYDLDLPDAIDFRESIIKHSDRNHFIAKSVFDTSWFDDIQFNKDNGILFIAGGVFHYFEEKKLIDLFCKLAKHFPKGEIFFDANSKEGLEISNQIVRSSGNHNALMTFSVDDPSSMEDWSHKIKLIASYPYFKDIPRSKKWQETTRVNMDKVDESGMCKYIFLRFEE
ncbi:class I SAM-dependent methyltransferase [Clostridium sp. Marseille-QA1073]